MNFAINLFIAHGTMVSVTGIALGAFGTLGALGTLGTLGTLGALGALDTVLSVTV